MTLLICASSARPETVDGALFDALTTRLDEGYPLVFSVVVTGQPPSRLPRSTVRDWVTLPMAESGAHAEGGVWSDADQCAARLLSAFATQVKPRATLLIGDKMRELRSKCTDLGGAAPVFGREFGKESDDDFSTGQLFEALDALLPAALVVGRGSSIDSAERALRSQATRPEIHVYWDGQVALSCADVAALALDLTPGTVRMQFRLRDVIKQPPRGLLALHRLSRRPRSRLNVVFVAEAGAALRCGEGITRILASRRDES